MVGQVPGIKKYKWTSKQLGHGLVTYYADFNSISANGLEAEITILALNPQLDKYPKISEVGFPCNCQGRMFTFRVDMKQLKVWMAQLALGIPVVTNQRISFA